jgi:phospholipid N-methyltransferase
MFNNDEYSDILKIIEMLNNNTNEQLDNKISKFDFEYAVSILELNNLKLEKRIKALESLLDVKSK